MKKFLGNLIVWGYLLGWSTYLCINYFFAWSVVVTTILFFVGIALLTDEKILTYLSKKD